MKAAGSIMKFDGAGRVVIPKPLRDRYGFKKDVEVEFFSDDRGIYIKKYEPACFICESLDNIMDFKDKKICKNCFEKLKKGV